MNCCFNTCKPTWSSWSVHLQMMNSIQNKTINTALLRSRSRRSLDRGDAQQAAQEHKEPQGDAQQVEEGGSGTWLHAGATKHRAKVAVHKEQVATALRQRKADAVARMKIRFLNRTSQPSGSA